LINRNFNLSKAKLQKEEVEKITWFSIEEMQKLITRGEFLKSHIVLFNHLLKYLEKKH